MLEQSDDACPTAPLPPSHMNFTSIYTDKTEGTSIIDAHAENLYRQQTNAINQYETQIYKWIEKGFAPENNTRNKSNKQQGPQRRSTWLFQLIYHRTNTHDISLVYLLSNCLYWLELILDQWLGIGLRYMALGTEIST